MSGWDTSSRPSWGQQDGPEDGTQNFSVPDYPSKDFSGDQADGSEEGGSSSPPPEFFGDEYRPQQFQKRTPGATLGGRELPGRGSPAGDPPARDRNGRGKHSAEPGGSPLNGSLPNGSLPNGSLPNGSAQNGSGPNVPPWQEPARSETPWPEPARGEPAWPEPARSEPAWPEPARSEPAWQQESARSEPTRVEPAWPDTTRSDYGRPDPGIADFGRPDAGRPDSAQPELPSRDLARRNPGRADYAAPADPAQQSPMAALSPDRLDEEHAARLDPALQDFFAPGGNRADAAPRSPGARGTLPPGPQGPGLPAVGQTRYPGNGRGEQGPRYNGSNGSNGSNGTSGAPWDSPAKHPRTGPLAAALTGPMLAVRGAAALVTPKENEPLRTRVLRYIGVTLVVVVAFVAGAYLLTHDKGTSVTATGAQADPQPVAGGQKIAAASPTPTATKSKSTGKSKSGTSSTTSSADYVLSTPATAGGYPMGTDPEFLATATTTAQGILSAVSSGGGKVTGSAVSAAYRLPNAQVVTFVGYHGNFTPSKVISSMGSYGTTDGTYRDAKAGDSIACANTAASGSTTSGAVCVWATSTTIGVTEFFDVSGPEALTSSQFKGADITEQVRAGVETKKS